jgi:hypothetical protein
MSKTTVILGALTLSIAANPAAATTLAVNLVNPPEQTYKSGNEWLLKTQGVTFHGDGPVQIGGGGVYTYDVAIYDGGPGAFTLENLPFTAKSITFDLSRIHTSTLCDILKPQTCIDANKIGASAYDTLGNLLGSFITTDGFASYRFVSDLGIGRVAWIGSTANDGRSYPQYYGNGSLLSNLVIDSAVPEPATWSLMIAGFGMIGGATRYRRNRTARVTSA